MTNLKNHLICGNAGSEFDPANFFYIILGGKPVIVSRKLRKLLIKEIGLEKGDFTPLVQVLESMTSFDFVKASPETLPGISLVKSFLKHLQINIEDDDKPELFCGLGIGQAVLKSSLNSGKTENSLENVADLFADMSEFLKNSKKENNGKDI